MMKKADTAVVNQRLIDARKEHKWTQDEVAQMIDTTPNMISRWERGITFLHPDHRDALCRLFGKSAEELGLTRKAFTAGQPRESLQPASTTFLLDPFIPSLPVGIDTLVGREIEQGYLAKHLLEAKTQNIFLSLYGTPGVGKTALATAIAHDPIIRSCYGDGILWAAVGPEANVLSLLSRWGSLLDITSSGANIEELHDIKDWVQVLRMSIGSRRMLLILDDIWKAEDAWNLTVGGTHCAYLMTTRFPELAIRYAAQAALPVHELDTQHSREVLAHFIPEIVAREPEKIGELVQSVGGLPLALLLIGKYLQVETYSGMQRRLREALQKLHDPLLRLQLAQPQLPENRSSFLTGDIPLSVYAAIALSDRYLKQQAQMVLRALAIFPAKPHSFSEEAALIIADTTTDVLNMLTDASLLEVTETERYTLHQTIADYGKLQQKDMLDTIEPRFTTYFVSYIEAHANSYQALSREIQHISLALDIAYERKMAEELIRGACALTSFSLAYGLYDIAELHLEHARQAAISLKDAKALARVLLCLGQVTERYRELHHAETLYEQGLVLAREQQESRLIRDFLANLGEVTFNRGDLDKAEFYVRDGLALAQHEDDQRQVCKLQKTLGEIIDNRGDFHLADELYLNSLAIAQEIHDEEMVITLLQNLGTKAYKEDRYDQAISYLQEGLTLAESIGHRHRQSALLTNLGMIAIELRDYAGAETYCQEGLAIARDLKNALRMSNALQNLGILEGKRGNGEQAERYLHESIDLARKIEQPWLIAEGLDALGEVYFLQQNIPLAQNTFEEALNIAREKGFQELLAHALFGLARLAEIQGYFLQAGELANESLELFRVSGHYRMAEVANWLAHCQIASDS
jgi:tetratricopeptide (TPR) repeat protein/transcriptional regulator with XRE-family HTH domain